MGDPYRPIFPSPESSVRSIIVGKAGAPLALAGVGWDLRRTVISVCAAVVLFAAGFLVGLNVHQHSAVTLSRPNQASTSSSLAVGSSQSVGAESVVPSLIGESLDLASINLEEAGLVGAISGGPPTGNGPVLISSQSPTAGTHVPKGTSVALTFHS